MFEDKLHFPTGNTAVAVLAKCSEGFFVEGFLVIFSINPQHDLTEIIEDDLTAAIVQSIFDILKLLLCGVCSCASHGTQQVIWRYAGLVLPEYVESFIVT